MYANLYLVAVVGFIIVSSSVVQNKEQGKDVACLPGVRRLPGDSAGRLAQYYRSQRFGVPAAVAVTHFDEQDRAA